ncbi:polysaccharide pyruvyl transferase family protein [Larkinella arboricola]
MELVYYKSEKGNFGDDLNGILWPELFPEKDFKDINAYFLGIGSILYNENKLIKSLGPNKKIVFGTGVRPTYNNQIKLDSSWDIKFLRGPLSAHALNDRFKYISDAAYALRLTKNFNNYLKAEKKYEVSVIPYFHSTNYFNWKDICETLGYNYISPLSEHGVEFTLQEMASSKLIITEAMHGAILADIFRVPWHKFVLSTPFTEGQLVSEFKWMDWLLSINLPCIKSTHIKFYRNNQATNILEKISNNIANVNILLKGRVKHDIIKNLSNIDKFYLSNDDILSKIDENIYEEIENIKLIV